jgi:putative ABC transport system ATP-binding protein
LSPRLECTALTKTFPSGNETLTVIDRIDLAVQAGEFVAILGPSGSGKSTLLGLLAGLERPTSGSVRLDGQPLEALDEDELALLRRHKVGFIFQTFQLLDNLTAEENVILPLELTGVPRARDRSGELFDRLGLEGRRHHYPAQLSGGEQQRVAIARAFAPRPSVLLADEPTGNLDRENGRRVLDLLLELRDHESVTLLLVTHDLEIGARAGRQVHLDGGRLVRDETKRAGDSVGAERSGGPAP